MRILPLSFDLPAALVTLALGTAGGLVAQALGLPLALLLGALVAVGTAAALGLRPLGLPVAIPQRTRIFFVPVIGVAIGGSFTPEVVAEMPGWWPSLLALLFFVPLSHWIGYQIYRRLGGLSEGVAFFGAVPGGLIEVVAMAEDAGIKAPLLILLQFLRLILTIVLVPLIFLALTGDAVGSGAGLAMTGAAPPPGQRDAVVLLLSGGLGLVLGHWLRLPAAIMTGPVLASGAAHLAGLTAAGPPEIAVMVTQVVVGTVLGARFAGLPRGALRLALKLTMVNCVVALFLAWLCALALSAVVEEPVAAVFLAFAPGGVAEMSLVALSLQVSVVYVAAHHVARIVLSVTVARVFAGRVAQG